MSFLKRISATFVAIALACAPMVTAVVALAPTTASAQAPAADAAKPAAPAAAPVVKKEMVDNPYGLKAMWDHGDWVSKGTLFILIFMSMGSWYILVVKLFEQSRLSKEAKEISEEFWKAGSLSQALANLKEGSAFRFIGESGMKATEHHSGLMQNVDLNTWVTMSIQRAADNVNSRMQDGLAFLATVGSTSPFVGLFGTVWGIYNALTAIGVAGQASIDKVAGPVGEALIMTAIGLGVAVPAVLSYNWLVRRNKVVMERIREFSANLHSVLMSGKAK